MSRELPLVTGADQLRQLASVAAPQACACALRHCGPWDSVPESDWPRDQLRAVATLRDPAVDEPSFAEYHPNGTRYESSDAPIAIAFFPFNRCDVWQCQRCTQAWLRYTEFGGYYVDHRSRRLIAEQVIDPPDKMAG